jgi:hypothetical protein
MTFASSLLAYVLFLMAFVIFDLSEYAIDVGKLVLFVDLPSLLVVLGGAITLTLAVARPPRGGFRGMLRPETLTSAQAGQAVRSLRAFRDVVLELGLAGAILGLLLMLPNLNDPSRIGPAMAISILSLFYGALLALPAHAASRHLEGAHRSAEGEDRAETLLLCIYGYPLVTLMTFGWLLFSFFRM